MSHHVETFFDDDGKWGWQCFDLECRQEATGFADIDSAQIDGDGHAARRDDATMQHMDNPPAVGAPKGWRWGYLACGCRNDGHGRHVR